MSSLPFRLPPDAPCRRVLFEQRLVDDLLASTWHQPTLVVLVFDDVGLLAAARDHAGIGPAEIEAACAEVVELSPVVGPSSVVLLSLDPGFGTEPSAAVCQSFRDLSRRLERSDAALVEWWLVGGGTRRSVAVACEEPW